MREHQRSSLGAALLSERHRVPFWCLAVFLPFWTLLALRPVERFTWGLENLPTIVVVVLCVATYRRFRFSDRAYLQGLCFLILHTVGSHYTYTRMPLGEWAMGLYGWSRNPYDRLVHFLFGLLVFRIVDELFVRSEGKPRGLFLSFAVIAWWSVAYELLEWIVAVLVAPEQGIAFLAVQGDQWDTQKDLAAAAGGAALAWVYEAKRRFLSRGEAWSS